MSRIKANIFDDLYRMSTQVGVWCEGLDGKTYRLKCEWVEVDRGMVAEPTLEDEPETINAILQAFADAAYRRGIKPSDLAIEMHESKHMQAHLEDMRRLVFHTLKVK